MGSSRRFLLPLAVLAAGILLFGCGSSGDERELKGEPFTSTELTDWTAVLDDIDELNTAGECEDADRKLATLTDAVQLSESDEALKADLVTLLDDLDAQLATDCKVETETTSSTTSTETTESTPTTTEETTVTEETTTEEEPTEPTTTTTTTTPEEPTGPPQVPPGQGGVPPGQEGGIGPGSFEPGRKSITP